MSVHPPQVDLTDTPPSTQRVWRELQQADGAVTRAELSERAGVAKPTVSAAVGHLNEKGLVEIGHDPLNPIAQTIEATEGR